MPFGVSVTSVAAAPLRAAALAARAADDLHVLADRARAHPDVAEEVRDAVAEALAELRALTVVATALEATAREIATGGDALRRRADILDAHAAEIVVGGADLTAVAERLATQMRMVTAALPRVLEALGSVEQLEDSVGTVAETVEPLQGAAEGVGRLTRRLGGRRER